jgi:hypothetical protein
MHMISVLAAERPGIRVAMFARMKEAKRGYVPTRNVLCCRATTLRGIPCTLPALSLREVRRRNAFGANTPFGFCHTHAISIDRFNRAQRGERRLFEAPAWREFWPNARQCVARTKNGPNRGRRCRKMACTNTTVCEMHGGMGLKRLVELRQAGEPISKRSPEERDRLQRQKRRQARERRAERRDRVEAGNVVRRRPLPTDAAPVNRTPLADEFYRGRGDRPVPMAPLYPGSRK